MGAAWGVAPTMLMSPISAGEIQEVLDPGQGWAGLPGLPEVMDGSPVGPAGGVMGIEGMSEDSSGDMRLLFNSVELPPLALSPAWNAV